MPGNTAAGSKEMSNGSSVLPEHGNRKLADYCSFIAEKTGRIGKNVGNFMQSKGLLPARNEERSDERNTAFNNNNGFTSETGRNDRSVHPNSTGPSKPAQHFNNVNEDNDNNGCSKHRDHRKHGKHFYPDDTVAPSSTCNLNLGNCAQTNHNERSRRVHQVRRQELLPFSRCTDDLERRVYATLPRRNKTLGFQDYAYPDDCYRGSRYPKSLQDLTDLEIEKIIARGAGHPNVDFSLARYSAAKSYRKYAEEENYMKLYKSLSRLDRSLPRGKYAPGRVHYEREYRIYGKDTVALIYYKTCYL